MKIINQIQQGLDGTTVEMVLIDNEDGTFVSMTKAHFDELEAAKEAQSL